MATKKTRAKSQQDKSVEAPVPETGVEESAEASTTQTATTSTEAGVAPEKDSAAIIQDLLTEFKAAVEFRDWSKLADLITVERIWFNDRMVKVNQVLEYAQAQLASREDIELRITNILDSELTDTDARISLAARLLSSDGDTWEEFATESKLHFGFEKGESGDWAMSFLGVTPPEAEAKTEAPTDTEPPPPPESYFAATGGVSPVSNTAEAAYFGATASANYFESTAQLNYFAATAAAESSYFAASMPMPEAAPISQPQAAPAPTTEPPAVAQATPSDNVGGIKGGQRMGMVYVPMFLPEDVLRGLIGNK